MEQRFVQVLSTFGTEEEAHRIAEALVEARLAACVQILGPIRSTYRWGGEVRTDQEWLGIAKTTEAGFEALADAIRRDHSYDVPEITATPIARGSEAYLEWIRAEVGPPEAGSGESGDS